MNEIQSLTWMDSIHAGLDYKIMIAPQNGQRVKLQSIQITKALPDARFAFGVLLPV